ncbi:Sec-independent protein translocase subunit TatA [Thermoactinospora rubra]|uniref:Sec-independent protein translocase subunit TatA n=1 Tax=Thermoactinospora rubra TaxID=1088767 RepID=UPI000A0FD663|nr:Sec-independent protein translocase subunit TatA [Thermoactinospora rubra]
MNLGPTEIILILLVLVLLFGAKKLPDLARGVGRSLRIFKAETSGLVSDDDKPSTVVQAQPVPPQQAQQPQIPAAAVSPEEQARRLEEEAARLRARAKADNQG